MSRAADTVSPATVRRLNEAARESSRGMSIIDRMVLMLLRWRINRFALAGDTADKLADWVVMSTQIISDELARRNRVVEEWARAARAVNSAKASRRRFVSPEVEESESSSPKGDHL